jgi:hypothetical protein
MLVPPDSWPLGPAEYQRFPMPCGLRADQGYHDHGWF